MSDTCGTTCGIVIVAIIIFSLTLIIGYKANQSETHKFEFFEGRAIIIIESDYHKVWGGSDKMEYTLEPGNWTIKYYIEGKFGRIEEGEVYSYTNDETLINDITIKDVIVKFTIKLDDREESRKF